MAPVLRPDDWVIAVRPASIRRGAIVVLEHPERPGFELIKRVTGLPGDSLGALTLRPDQFWVAGEELRASSDSRWFGPISRPAIRGVAVLRYWPPRRIGWIRAGR
jgi:type IV secretory pathway protease TraF